MGNVVFWSGGEDSTLVAIKLLRADKPATLISIDNSCIGGARQQNLEAISRKRCLDKMKKEFSLVAHKNVVFDADFAGTSTQPEIFMGLFPLLCKDGDTIHHGAIKTDTFWHRIDRLRPAFDAMCKACDIKLNLEFPLEWYDKKQVRNELKKYGYLEFTIHSGDAL